ncbi:UDP-galactopyranose mutase [Bdellovibrio bacteriovorus]|uniref:UDP-galactopyranose mutase n=1 Tax=Bdellovibrio bacteriovorus TaxID=959 RepID=A0A161PTG2_BDEBC|nr:UDP-galactopyranose mutase [Bdellovibrio bacteriovorus]KYG68056.1 UDP-galactopyranose mutase [Bdellovibrio bacteriovorus]
MKTEIGIAGAGFAGAVLARELAETGRFKITVFDEREHIAGNCHTVRDPETGVMVHEYGPHIFNTSRQDVWDYVNRWSPFIPFTNRVKAVTEKGVFSLPVNLLTINQFFQKKMTPLEAEEFIKEQSKKDISEPQTFEEQALKFLGPDLYRNFFYGYTKKQWGVEPTELPASILKRLPVRFNYDDNYYNQKYQGIPQEGYTAIVKKILDHPAIEVRLKTRLSPEDKSKFHHIFWSGPMDGYFKFKLGRLRYRTLKFERFTAEGDFQGNPVINYCEEQVPYTRITEHKHFAPWEEHQKTVCFKEYSALCTEKDTPYYPLRLSEDMSLLKQYMELAESEKNVTFIGRLGTYRYLDMHVVIGESLDLAKVCLDKNTAEWPRFSHSPI